MVTLLITILPSLLIVTFFVKSDRFPEPTKEIIKIFFYGIFLCFPAFYLNSALGNVYDKTAIGDNLISSFLNLKLAMLDSSSHISGLDIF